MTEDGLEQIEDQVRLALAAWCEEPADVQAYRRLVDVVDEWNAYLRPAPSPHRRVTGSHAVDAPGPDINDSAR